MHELENNETVGFLRCHLCQADLLEHDKFCRKCGISQRLITAPLMSGMHQTEDLTKPLPSTHRCCSLSGALVNVVTANLAAQTAPLRDQRWALGLVTVLIALPLWLMILLLSPLDAIVAARAVARQA